MQALKDAERRHRHHGVRAAVRAAGVRHDPEARHDPVSPVAAAEVPRPVARSTGRSSRGDTKTGLTIFRPTDGLDEGPVILQKETPIGPDDTLGSVYFDRLFPMGVQAMLEAADLVVAGKHKEIVQDESQATYEGWFRDGGGADQLGQPRRFRLQPDPRLQSGARRVDHAERQEAADLRRAQAPVPHLRRGEGQDRRGLRGHRRRASSSPRRAGGSRCCKAKARTARSSAARSWRPPSVAAGHRIGHLTGARIGCATASLGLAVVVLGACCPRRAAPVSRE